MNEVDIVKIVINVLINLPLLMALVLYFDYKINGKYNIEFRLFEYEELKEKTKDDLMIRLVEKLNEVVHKNEW